MIPQNATHRAVRTEAMTIIVRLNLLTFRPNCLACSSPIMNRLNSLAQNMAIMDTPMAGMNTIQAFSQVMLAKDPNSHHMALVRLSLAMDRNMVWKDENANPVITPARM